MNSITFTVPFVHGKERPRVTRLKTGAQIVYTPKLTRNNEAIIGQAYKAAGGVFIEGPVALDIVANIRIPASWSKKKKEQALNNEIYPEKKPDADNIAKEVLDGLKLIAFSDDKQCIQLHIRKVYADDLDAEDYTVIKVSPYVGDDVNVN